MFRKRFASEISWVTFAESSVTWLDGIFRIPSESLESRQNLWILIRIPWLLHAMGHSVKRRSISAYCDSLIPCEAAKILIFSKNHYDFQTQHPKNCRKRQGTVSTAKKVSVGPPLSEAELTIMCTKCCYKRLCFLGFCHFSKKIWVLAARLGARNFTRALGYAKHPLSVAHAFADARFCRCTLSQTLAFADAHFCRRTLLQTHVFGRHTVR